MLVASLYPLVDGRAQLLAVWNGTVELLKRKKSDSGASSEVEETRYTAEEKQ